MMLQSVRKLKYANFRVKMPDWNTKTTKNIPFSANSGYPKCRQASEITIYCFDVITKFILSNIFLQNSFLMIYYFGIKILVTQTYYIARLTM